ncbi:MAG TPA: hypothetical protein VFM32_08625 [Spongiibacteraceae bacterium]|nr:hypothetical protein [Spongiibacteraceae bacterium]
MAIYCVVFELQRGRDEYRQFFQRLDAQQQAFICQDCRLLFSRNSAESLQTYFENFIHPGDTLFVGEISHHWTLNRDFEATEWLRELQMLELNRQRAITHDNDPSAQQAPQ